MLLCPTIPRLLLQRVIGCGRSAHVRVHRAQRCPLCVRVARALAVMIEHLLPGVSTMRLQLLFLTSTDVAQLCAAHAIVVIVKDRSSCRMQTAMQVFNQEQKRRPVLQEASKGVSDRGTRLRSWARELVLQPSIERGSTVVVVNQFIRSTAFPSVHAHRPRSKGGRM